MLFVKFPILASLVATSTAIDFRWYAQRGCSGHYWQCTNINPDRCCSVGRQDTNSAISWNAIPSDWNILGLGYWQEGCNGTVAGSGQSGGSPDLCFPTPQYRAGRYYFASARSNIQENLAENGEPCQKPDLIVYEDGTDFDLTELTNEQYAQVVSKSPPYDNRNMVF
ncbi:uncharacterized protein B0I36DRAFT_258168 [Microdochium trichocladiopsis]|uniref:Uncharacterized protein n=1 Tax=Microdochium trichocladiopsis TaxID=1682393 RepID=A0A9P8XR45_9PEZI|nr:uncharacterized protein B0I36DRAFT_258168 [Microdochium trichocladiopsis]KAH7009143.1 hypothetical protein B0I36DRAFT_258168 [Microdochium trichocladiopsis]